MTMTSQAPVGSAAAGTALAGAVDALVKLACHVTGFDENAISRDAMARVAKKLFDDEREAHRIVAACERRDASVVEACVAACVVNETYLFRQPEHFAFVEALAADAATAGNGLRAWSAGCATGEEAWSLAASLVASFASAEKTSSSPRLSWPIDVLATDVLATNIDAARAAVCKNAARQPAAHPAASARRAQVRDVVDEEGRVRQVLRPFVRFAVHDLRTPPPELGFDVIFCRNVLMFLARDVATAVLAHLASALAPTGVLVLGPVDTTAVSPSAAGLVLAGAPELNVYCVKRFAEPARPLKTTATATTATTATFAPRTRAQPTIAPAPEAAPTTTTTMTATMTATTTTAAATTTAHAPLREDGQEANAVAAHVRALAALEVGDLDGAMRHLVDATRAEPAYAPALVERALLLDRAGDDDGAVRAMSEALARLAPFAPDDVLPGPEPLPARFWAASAKAFLDRHERQARRENGARGR